MQKSKYLFKNESSIKVIKWLQPKLNQLERTGVKTLSSSFHIFTRKFYFIWNYRSGFFVVVRRRRMIFLLSRIKMAEGRSDVDVDSIVAENKDRVKGCDVWKTVFPLNMVILAAWCAIKRSRFPSHPHFCFQHFVYFINVSLRIHN